MGQCHGMMSGGMCRCAGLAKVDALGEELQPRIILNSGASCVPQLWWGVWVSFLASDFICWVWRWWTSIWGLVEREGGCWEKSTPCAWGLVSVQRVWPLAWTCVLMGCLNVGKPVWKKHLSPAQGVCALCWLQHLPCLLHRRALLCPDRLGCLQCSKEHLKNDNIKKATLWDCLGGEGLR